MRLRSGAMWPRWVLAPVLALAGLGGAAQGSIPEDPGPLWSARYNGPGNGGDEARSLAVSPDGSKVFVTGSSRDGSGAYDDYATISYDSAGNGEVWSARYDGPGNSDDQAYSLAVSPDGSKVFVTGGSMGSGSGYDYATLAYDSASGAQLWVSRYNGPGNYDDYARSLAVSPDGSKVFVTGYSRGSGSGYDYATVAYESTTGAQLWSARYNGPGNSGDFAYSLAVSPDGSKVFVTGYSRGSGSGSDYATVAYESTTGAQLWAARYNGPLNSSSDSANSLAVSPDDSKVFVTGYSSGSGSYYDYATVAYDSANGAQLWVSRYNGPGNYEDSAYSLAVSPDGSKVFVTGGSDGSGSYYVSDYATVAYDSANGAQLWAARYDGPGNYEDFAYSLAVSPDGSKVFVTGGSESLSSIYDPCDFCDYATVAYDSASGAQLWVSRYNGPGNYRDVARSLAVSPDGSWVFVTGYSWGGSSSYDYATVAYRATSCASGMNETGPVSGPVHAQIEPVAGPGAPYVHGVNCDLVTANGL